MFYFFFLAVLAGPLDLFGPSRFVCVTFLFSWPFWSGPPGFVFYFSFFLAVLVGPLDFVWFTVLFSWPFWWAP